MIRKLDIEEAKKLYRDYIDEDFQMMKDQTIIIM